MGKEMLKEDPTDKELWKCFQQENAFLFSRLYEKYQQELFGYVFRILQNREDAKTVLHELFVHLWQERKSLPQVDFPKAYLITALRRRSIRYRQYYTRFLSTDQDGEGLRGTATSFVFSPEDILIHCEKAETLQKQLAEAINDLPPRQREIIYLRYYQELTIPEISQILELSYQTVANHLQAAYRSLSKDSKVSMLVALTTGISLLLMATDFL
ncbi:sigma-70 family RNA polymerase sigma factor [soil metagenome]|jgi:RNA polymerase sigma factor (sigma-70 family)